MKKIFFAILIINSLINADIIPTVEGKTTILVNTQVSNIDQYPNTKFVVCGYGMRDGSPSPFGISSCQELNSSMTIHGFIHHFSANLLYAVPKTLYETTDIITTLKSYTPVNGLSDKIFQPSYSLITDESIDDKYKIDEETRIYQITSVTDNNVTLKLEKRIIHFTDGEANKTINY